MEGEYSDEPKDPEFILALAETSKEEGAEINGDLKQEMSSGGIKISNFDKSIEETSYLAQRPSIDYAKRLQLELKIPYYENFKELIPGKEVADAKNLEKIIEDARNGYSGDSDTRLDILASIEPMLTKQDELTKKQIDYLLGLDPSEASDIIDVIMDRNYPNDPTPQDEWNRYMVITRVLTESGSEVPSLSEFRRLMEVIDNAVLKNEQVDVRGHIPPSVVTRAMRQPSKYTVTKDEKGYRKIQEKKPAGIEGDVDPFKPKDTLTKRVEAKYQEEFAELQKNTKGILKDALNTEQEANLNAVLLSEINSLSVDVSAKVEDWYKERLSQEEHFRRSISELRAMMGKKADGYNDRGLYESFIAPLAQARLKERSLSNRKDLADAFIQNQSESVTQAIVTGEMYSKESLDIISVLSNIQARVGNGITITEDTDNITFVIDMGNEPFNELARYKDPVLRDAATSLSRYAAHNHFLFDTTPGENGKVRFSVKKLIP